MSCRWTSLVVGILWLTCGASRIVAQGSATIAVNTAFRLAADYQQNGVQAVEIRLYQDGGQIAVQPVAPTVEFAFTSGLPQGTYLFSVAAVEATGLESNNNPSFLLTVGDPPPQTGLALSSVSPSSGPLSGGTSITMVGTGFVSGMTISMCGLSDETTFVSATEVQARTAPCATEGPTEVRLTRRSDNVSVSLPNGFTYGNGGTQCTFTLAPTSIAIPAVGGNGVVTVTTQAGCAWSVFSTASWLGVAPMSGSGSGSVTWTAPANPDTTSRAGAIAVASQSVTVTQAGVPIDQCVSAPLVIDQISWPSTNTGRRSLTFRSSHAWQQFVFVWPGALTVTDTRGCVQTVNR